MKLMKQSLQKFSDFCENHITLKIKEQKDHLSTSIRVIEHDIGHVVQDLKKISTYIEK